MMSVRSYHLVGVPFVLGTQRGDTENVARALRNPVRIGKPRDSDFRKLRRADCKA